MNKIKAFLGSALILIAFFSATPAQAVVYNGVSGDISCSISGKIVVVNNIVTSFSDCAGEVVIPEGIVRVLRNTSVFNTSLTAVTIPSSAAVLDIKAFLRLSALQSITVETGNPNYASESGILLNKSKSILIQHPRACSAILCPIPASVTELAEASFTWSSLTSIHIPSGVTRIGMLAFQGASSLEAVTFSADSQLREIYYHAFESDISLQSFNVPQGVVLIGQEAFLHTPELRSFTFQAGSQPLQIDDWAFEDSGFSSITLPQRLMRLGSGVFAGLSVAEVNFEQGSLLTSIGDYGFYETYALTSISIPESVSSIGVEAFLNSGVTSVIFMGDAPVSIGSDAFSGVPAGAKAFVAASASGFPAVGSLWNGLVIARAVSVSFNSNFGSSVPDRLFTGVGISEPIAPVRTGYTFLGWSETVGGGILTFPYSPSSGDVTLIAKWSSGSANTGQQTVPLVELPQAQQLAQTAALHFSAGPHFAVGLLFVAAGVLLVVFRFRRKYRWSVH